MTIWYPTATDEGEAKTARTTIQRLVALYEAWGRPKKAAEYRSLVADSEEP